MKMSADQKLAKAGAVMYDCEIFKAIPVQGEVRDPKLQYCGGWEDYSGMGISLITAYDFVMQDWGIYMGDNIHEFKTLVNSRNIIIGYNNKRFDDNLCTHNGIYIDPAKSYDLWKAIVDTQLPGERGGFKLDSMLKANGITPKGGLGADAPKQAQMGLWGELCTYGLGDTNKQVQLLRKACNGTMRSPKNGEYMTIKLPWEAVKVDMGGLF